MTIYFGLVVFIYLYGELYRANSSKRRRKNYLIVTFGLLILIAGLRNLSVGIDLAGHYAKRFTMIASYSWKQIPNFSAIIGYEIGYCYYTKLLTVISTDVQLLTFVTSLLIYSALGYFIYKESTDVVLSTELMMFSCLYYMCMNILRQGLAVSLVLVAYVWLDYSERKLSDYIKFILMIVLAATFHSSAILCLVMVLFDRLKFTKKQILIGLATMVLAYLLYDNLYSIALGLFGSGNNYERYLTSATEGVGNMNKQTIYNFCLAFLGLLFGYYELVWKKKSIKTLFEKSENAYTLQKRESFMLYMVLVASVCRLLIFRMNIINRFTYYFIPFLLVLYPYSLSACSLKSNRRILKFSIYLIFGIYFTWMTVNKAAEFYGVVPYSFCWQ